MAYRREQTKQYLGRELLHDNTGGERIDYDGELHRMTVGAPGVGKTLRLLAPNLLTVFGKSMVVIDPKGQLAAITACYRKEQGDDVYVIDPFGVLAGFAEEFPDAFSKLDDYGLTETWGFDPLAGLRPGPTAGQQGMPLPGSKTYYEDVAGLAEALVRIDADAREPHWPQSARQLVTGLIMWEIEREKQPGEIASLAHVYELLTEPDRFMMMSRMEEVWDDKLQCHVEKEVVWRQQTAGLLITIKKMATSDSRQMRSLASRFDTDKPSDEVQSIKSNANTHLAWLLSDAIAANLTMPADRCVDFNEIKQRPTTVYIVLEPGYIESHSIWLRLFINAVFRAARKTRGPHEVLLMIDEFPVLGFLEVIQSQWTVCRDYNLLVWITMQDMSQLQRLYPGSWSSIVSGCGVKQFFPNRRLSDSGLGA